jgi:hypothetical protein
MPTAKTAVNHDTLRDSRRKTLSARFVNVQRLVRVGSDIHEEASVKTGARRARNFPDIHSASSTLAERHELYAVAPLHTGGDAT